VWWVDLGLLPGTNQAIPSLPLHKEMGEKTQQKGSGLRSGQGGHLPVTITGKTDCTWGNQFHLLPIKSEQCKKK